jgi:putative transposase
MTEGLKRYQQTGDFHFVTFSCYQRQPYLGLPAPRNLFEEALERTRSKYKFGVIGYVVIPEHVHLLLTEPVASPLAKALMALKISSSKRLKESPFWQIRYYDFNVFTRCKQVEKLRYIHRNPVRRGLVDRPEDWEWSSFRHYLTGERATVEIESSWTSFLREAASMETRITKNNKEQ